jgi:hypothetical protein
MRPQLVGRAPNGQLRALLVFAALMAALLVPRTDVIAEDLPVHDERVMPALALLDASPATNQLRNVLDRNRVTVQFVQMAPGVYARYSVARHAIEIDNRWSNADTVTIAAVIAHEATHAHDAVSGYLTGESPNACIDSEIRAFRTSALFWLDVYGTTGKPLVADELDRQLNLVAERQLRDPHGLEDLVRQTYSAQCG